MMKQWKTRFIFMASFLVIGAAALVLYSCGGGGGSSSGGGGGGGGSTQIQTASQGAQAAATSTTAVTSIVGSVGNLGISFTKPLLNARGKTLLGPRHYKDSRAKLAADIRGKMMASKPMQKKMALMKTHFKAKTALALVTTTFWSPCDNYDGTDLDQSGNPLDPTTLPTGTNGSGTKGYSISSNSFDDESTTNYGGTTEFTDVDCQTYTTDQDGNITGLSRLNGVSTYAQTNYTETTNTDGSESSWSLSFSGTTTGLTSGEPNVFEIYTNPTPSPTPPTDLTLLTKDFFLESDFDMSGSYSDDSTLDLVTSATTDATTHNLTVNKGTEHFGTTDTNGTTDFTFAYTNLTDSGTENLTDDNLGSSTDNSDETINGGFSLNLTETVSVKPTAAKAALVTTTVGFSVELTSFNYKDNYSSNSETSAWDDYNEYSGKVKITLTPADICFDGTFTITTETPVHTSSTASSSCPIDGHLTINGDTTVTYNSDGSVDVSVGGGEPTHYATCDEFEAEVCLAAGNLSEI
jgi:hypothetical protein